MLLLIIRKEIAHNVLSSRFLVSYLLLIGLVGLSAGLMAHDYRLRAWEYAAEVDREQARVSEIAAIENPTAQWMQVMGKQYSGFRGFRPPEKLSILARGLEKSLPVQISSTRFGSRFVSGSGEDRLGRNLLFALFEAPDFVSVVNLALSLLALLCAFDAVCGEKEQGTLRLLLSHAVPRDMVLLGKWIGGFLTLTAPFCVAVLGGIAYIRLSGILMWEDDLVLRLTLIVALSLLYVSVFFTLGLLISVLAQQSSTALLLSLMVWVGWVLVVPNLAPVAVQAVVSVPKSQAIEREKLEISGMREKLNYLAMYGKADSDLARQQQSRQEAAEQRLESMETFFEERRQELTRLGANLARLSPSACYLLAATRLAGTGPNLSTTLSRSRRLYQQRCQVYLQQVEAQGEWVEREGMKTRQIQDLNWFSPAAVPRFRMLAESLGSRLDAVQFDALLLVLYNVLFFMLAYISFMRSDAT